ncbi:hypothetical protein N8Z37_01290 [Octadecabacter sp.]|nr:hypothetical protein [Octadecabacter sp.]
MNILVLSGTDSSSWIAKEILSSTMVERYSWVIQSKHLTQIPRQNVRTTSHVMLDNSEAEKYDVVISHAGAGSTFWALENNKQLITIVDLRRADKHQSDLGTWLHENRYSYVLQNRIPAIDEIEEVARDEFNRYHPDIFDIKQIWATDESIR